jgi:hypothetical protein
MQTSTIKPSVTSLSVPRFGMLDTQNVNTILPGLDFYSFKQIRKAMESVTRDIGDADYYLTRAQESEQVPVAERSKQICDKFNQEVLGPMVTQLQTFQARLQAISDQYKG